MPAPRGEAASRASDPLSDATAMSQNKTVVIEGAKTSGTAPSATNATVLPVITTSVHYRGTETVAKTVARTDSVGTPSSSASDGSWMQCRSLAFAITST